jgi:hypothetical protein
MNACRGRTADAGPAALKTIARCSRRSADPPFVLLSPHELAAGASRSKGRPRPRTVAQISASGNESSPSQTETPSTYS